MNPDTANLLIVFCLALIVTATALLLRVWRDVKRLDEPDEIIWPYPGMQLRRDRRYCQNHTRALIRKD